MTDLMEKLVGVSESDWAICEENVKYHISSACLEAQQSIKIKIKIIDLTMKKKLK
jgi:hypothetical protein